MIGVVVRLDLTILCAKLCPGPMMQLPANITDMF